jgi:hypothetical protein
MQEYLFQRLYAQLRHAHGTESDMVIFYGFRVCNNTFMQHGLYNGLYIRHPLHVALHKAVEYLL